MVSQCVPLCKYAFQRTRAVNSFVDDPTKILLIRYMGWDSFIHVACDIAMQMRFPLNPCHDKCVENCAASVYCTNSQSSSAANCYLGTFNSAHSSCDNKQQIQHIHSAYDHKTIIGVGAYTNDKSSVVN